MSELDDFSKNMRELTEYNRVQLRQTLEFYEALSELIGTKQTEENGLAEFEEKWLGIHSKDKEEN